ncbi:centrosomal protein of 95 kDa, partial [Carlito syrichta]|uniref:Centrosomal protein of 95 kDa n=1 Tax=Carlito syrichta TaxID=1868482 RepID=A0A1U7TCC8_CARSF
LIAVPRSPEDDAHNIQAVIDSLALDYLQVSLSHITGENIVKGDQESIKNLLEIFDGLLEYLTEHGSETAREKSETGEYFRDSDRGEPVEEPESAGEPDSSWKGVPCGRCSLPSEALGPSWEGDDAESAGEIIRLGDTAHTFSLRSHGAQIPSEVQSGRSSASPVSKSREDELCPPPSRFLSKNRTYLIDDWETPSVSAVPRARKLGEPVRAAVPLHPPYQPAGLRAPCPVGREHLWSGHGPPTVGSAEGHAEPPAEPGDRVLISTLPKDGRQEVYTAQARGPQTRKPLRGQRDEHGDTALSCSSPFPQRPGKRFSEQELHLVSEKLSQRLLELDWMLKIALGGRVKEEPGDEEGAGDEEVERGHEETLSQHSDGIVEYGLQQLQPGPSARREPPRRSHSLSPSPVNRRRPSRMERRGQRQPKEADTRHFRAKVLTEAFERELRRKTVQENVRPPGTRDEEEEPEKTYRDTVDKGTPGRCQPWKIYSREATTQSPRGSFPKPGRAATPVQVGERGLLPLLLEHLPFLCVSGPTLSRMWRQQVAQLEQLKKEARRDSRSQKKLQVEVAEALRRQDLLTALVKKEHEHSRRLQDVKDRVHRQRLMQSKVKENRQQVARAQKYYDDYRVQLRARMLRMRTREEMIFKKLFEEGLQIQKQRLRDLRNYAKDKRNEQRRQHQAELDSMENYYKDQFSLLAEAISQERQELKARETSRAQVTPSAKPRRRVSALLPL